MNQEQWVELHAEKEFKVQTCDVISDSIITQLKRQIDC